MNKFIIKVLVIVALSTLSEAQQINCISATDCHKFYECGKEGSIMQTCPNGTAFNSFLQFCDWEENVPECNVGLMPPGKNIYINRLNKFFISFSIYFQVAQTGTRR